jgi:hypothetical protein
MSPNSSLFASRMAALDEYRKGKEGLIYFETYGRPPPIDPKNPPSSIEIREALRASIDPVDYQRKMNAKFAVLYGGKESTKKA